VLKVARNMAAARGEVQPLSRLKAAPDSHSRPFRWGAPRIPHVRAIFGPEKAPGGRSGPAQGIDAPAQHLPAVKHAERSDSKPAKLGHCRISERILGGVSEA
jgi:hypothetical protein